MATRPGQRIGLIGKHDTASLPPAPVTPKGGRGSAPPSIGCSGARVRGYLRVNTQRPFVPGHSLRGDDAIVSFE